MTQNLESEVSLICNLSKGVEEKGIEQGIKQGIEQDIEQGIEKMISTLKDLNIQNDTILQKLQEKFNLTLEEAQSYVRRY